MFRTNPNLTKTLNQLPRGQLKLMLIYFPVHFKSRSSAFKWTGKQTQESCVYCSYCSKNCEYGASLVEYLTRPDFCYHTLIVLKIPMSMPQ